MKIAGLRAVIGRALGAPERFQPKMHWHVECVRNGNVIWADDGYNLIVNTGINDALEKWLKGSAYTAAFFVGLAAGTPTPAADDTMASHAGWVEVTGYDEATRAALTLGSVAAMSVSNTASKAVFAINGTSTVGGAFLTTNSAKSGITGTLISIKAFSAGNRSVVSGDELRVTVTVTGSSAA